MDIVMETTKNKSVSAKVMGVIGYILMIAMGIYLLFNKIAIVWLFSAAAAVHGLMLTVRYFIVKAKNERELRDIIAGVISLLFGIAMFFGGTESRVAGVLGIETFVAVWSLFAGFAHVWGSFALKKLGVNKWSWMMTGGILMIFCGVAFISMPLLGLVTLVNMGGIYAGVSFIIAGATGLTSL